MSEGPGELVAAWLSAVGRREVADALGGVYRRAGEEIERRGPVCWASGRCCNFRRTGHLLYVTGLEAAYTLSRRGGPGLERLDAAVAEGNCPYQVLNRCGVHADKPLGCRLYFCDRSSLPWQHDLYERLLGELRSLHASFSVPYRYGEWRAMMRTVMEHGGLDGWSPPEEPGEVRLTVEGREEG